MSEESEVFLRSGESWFIDGKAVCERYGGLYLTQTDEGDIYVGIPGRGEVPLAELLQADGKPEIETSGDGKVAQFKPAPRRTD